MAHESAEISKENVHSRSRWSTSWRSRPRTGAPLLIYGRRRDAKVLRACLMPPLLHAAEIDAAGTASVDQLPAQEQPPVHQSSPSAGIVDSQSVKATDRGGLHGWDGAKKVNGIKRHLPVDTLGTVLKACVSPAAVSDRDGAMVLLSRARDDFPRLRLVWPDQGYRGQDFPGWARDAIGMTVQIVSRRDGEFARS